MQSCVEGECGRCHSFETEDGGFIFDGEDTQYDPTDPLKGHTEEERAKIAALIGEVPCAHWVEHADGSKTLEW